PGEYRHPGGVLPALPPWQAATPNRRRNAVNTQTLIHQSRLAAPYLRARIARSPLYKKIVSLFALDPCRIPAPVAVPVRRPRVIASAMVAMLAMVAVGQAHAQAWDVEPNRGRVSQDWDWSTDGRLVD